MILYYIRRTRHRNHHHGRSNNKLGNLLYWRFPRKQAQPNAVFTSNNIIISIIIGRSVHETWD